MPRKKEGHSQLAFETPDELLDAMRAAAEAAGMKLTAWINSTCAAAVGVDYSPPKLGRPAAEPDPPPKPARGKGSARPRTDRNSRPRAGR